MLDDIARITHYQTQTGGRMTDRQHRRIKHKRGHQSPQAAAVREAKNAEKSRVRAARKARLAGLLGR